MFGINPSEFIVLLVVAAVVLGPERLPDYAQQLARMVRELRRMAQGASSQVRSELGPEFDEIDWAKLDPRQYDPRRIVREALADVWDPDDPLGLKDGHRPHEPGDDIDGPGPGGAGWDGEKPQSAGGPAEATRRARAGNGSGKAKGMSKEEGTSNGTNVNLTKDAPVELHADGTPAPVPPPPAFDPDAT